jgi:hypothetical protein
LRFFERACKSELERAAWIAGFDAFAPSTAEAEISPFDLLPNVEGGYDEDTAAEYRGKLLCEIASEGNYETYERLYYDTPISDVWERIAIKRALKR